MRRRFVKLLSVAAVWVVTLPIVPLWVWLMVFVPTDKPHSTIFYVAALTFFIIPGAASGLLAWVIHRRIVLWLDPKYSAGLCVK